MHSVMSPRILTYFDALEEEPPDDIDSIIEQYIYQTNCVNILKSFSSDTISTLIDSILNPKIKKADKIDYQK